MQSGYATIRKETKAISFEIKRNNLIGHGKMNDQMNDQMMENKRCQLITTEGVICDVNSYEFISEVTLRYIKRLKDSNDLEMMTEND